VKPKERVTGILLVLAAAVVAVWAAVALGATPLLVDHGGRVLSTPRVSAIYLGDYWSTPQGAGEALHLDAFLQAWIAGPSVTGVLAQYRVGAGSFASSDKVAGASPVTFTDTDAQALVRQELAAGRVVSGSQTVHVVYLPPGTVLTVQGTSSQQALGGYHSSYLDSGTGARVYYAVVVYNQGANGIEFNRVAQDNNSIVTSSVLAGALTNPDAGQGQTGWLDDVNGEVGSIAFALSTDPALGDVWVLQNGFTVALLWSNQDGKLDAGSGVAIGATSTGVQTLSITPSTQEAIPGTSVTYTLSNAATSVDTLTLTVSDLPATLVATLGQTTLAPGASTTLTVAVDATAVVGTSATITVTGTSVTSTEPVTATLSIVSTLTPTTTPTPAAATPADFTMTVDPTSQTMDRGGDVAVFTITTTGDSNTTIKLKTSHVRRGIKAYLSRTRIAAGETATVTIIAHRDAPRKTYEFSVEGKSKHGKQEVPLTLVVQ
jgi:hypothetical protein